MTDTDRLIEAVARDLCRVYCLKERANHADGETIEDYVDGHFDAWMDEARAAVSRLRRWDAANGLVTVPRNLSEEMDRRMHIAVRDAPSSGRATERGWREALAAAPLPPGAELEDKP